MVFFQMNKRSRYRSNQENGYTRGSSRDHPEEDDEYNACTSFTETNGDITDIPDIQQMKEITKKHWIVVKKILREIFSFLMHAFGVALILFGGAVVFAYFEDRRELFKFFEYLGIRSPDGNKTIALNEKGFNGTNVTSNPVTKPFSTNPTPTVNPIFWSEIEQQLNLTLSTELKEKLSKCLSFADINKTETKADEPSEDILDDHHHPWYVLLKWFYFGVIVGTTVGYGDVLPITDNGRIFFMGFSLVAIAMLMSLLTRCGRYISSASNKLFALLNQFFAKYICKGSDLDNEPDDEYLSKLEEQLWNELKESYGIEIAPDKRKEVIQRFNDHIHGINKPREEEENLAMEEKIRKAKRNVKNSFLSLFSVMLLFVGFFIGGIYIIREMRVGEESTWSWTTTLYFWITTFTTVGFGDITNSLDEEIELWYIYFLYRIFGLSFLMAIIDAVIVVMDACNEVNAIIQIKMKDLKEKRLKELRDKIPSPPRVPLLKST